jgi:hypothetical protein
MRSDVGPVRMETQMNDSITIAFIPSGVDVEAGLRAAEALPDELLLEMTDAGLLGWGWELPGEDAQERPWADDPELVALELEGEVPPGIEARYLAAVRKSLSVGVRNAARLLAGEHPWFESRIVRRVPLASGGEMVLFAEDLMDDSVFSDTARLPIDLLPEVGRAMGVHGHDAVRISVDVAAS